MDNSYVRDGSGSVTDILPHTPGASSPIATASGRTSALSTRITSVLSTSYADLDLRDALETLDIRGFTNTQDSRRNLRLDLQQEVIQCNGEIIKAFGQVAEQLRRIGSVIESLNKRCADMRAHISASKEEVGLVVAEGNEILAQKSQIETKQQILQAFKTHFVISDDEVASLTSSSEPVNDEFFRVMAKVKKINQDSEVLLGTENEKLGLEILDQSSKQLNAAYQKLYRWIQKDFKTLDLENPQISSSIRRSLRVLAERPALFQSCMDFFAEAREHNLSDSFHAALTGGPGADTYGKPIEFHAHDPLRYVGDMLAWAHSAAVSEREALEVLFIAEGDELAKGIKAGIDADPWSRRDVGEQEEVYDGRNALNELVNRDLAGVARLLRQRTEQVISSHEDATLAYKIANLISFYRNTFEKLIGVGSTFLETLDTLESSAQRQFRANMRDHVASIQAELSVTPTNASPPDFLHECFETLRALMKSYDTSYAASKVGEEAFQLVLQEALDPFLKACESLSKRMSPPLSDMFMVNCILQAKMTLAPYSFVASKQAELDKILDQCSKNLIEIQYEFFVDNSGLEPIFDAIFSLADSKEDLAKIPGLEVFQPSALMAASQQLDEFLPSALMDAMDHLKQLESPVTVRNITEAAAEKFCADFEIVESKLIAADKLEEGRDGKENEPEYEKPRLRDLFPRTSDEIRVLLS
ncbi:uncharacterized protein PV09_03529 [Verruconis gallopava]|uniref:Conserved oligomeric Golgi complex subunit 6 n=1 Tax=Verruconis gallopava TaxID=253628 RepID=A0A0D2AGG4_9PEZI|nr:uncharacterized protein PV09_03529 [Verruconis gallopava]KIW05665.1 hypothetical protein PV09_03529 [Verruconis gallopava]